MHNLQKDVVVEPVTGKSFSEVLILVLTNPQYDTRLSIEFTSSVHENYKLRTLGEHVVYINCSEWQNKKQFVYITCSELGIFNHVLNT